MTTKFKLHQVAASVIISASVSGCVSLPSSPEEAPAVVGDSGSPAAVNQFNDLVSRDVVSVLQQIDELSPSNTVLGTSNDTWQAGGFADALKNELESVGYAIRSVAAGPDTIKIGFDISDNTIDVPAGWDGQSQTVIVTAGDVAVRRSYLINSQGAISPLGLMQIKGADATSLTLQRDLFDAPANGGNKQNITPVTPVPTPPVQQASGQIAQKVQSEPLTATTNDNQTTGDNTLALQTQGPAEQVTVGIVPGPEKSTFLDLVAPSIPVSKPSEQAALGLTVDKETENVMDLQQSNFEDLFADMAFVNEKVLTFANDSTRMGDANKIRLQELIANFDAGSDVFSLVGCSLGQTNHAGGQEALARARAMRVREELVYAGIPSDSIVEEGCWAEEAFDLRMPRRGVVVTLKRRVG